MGLVQEYFWACILDDGTQVSEFNPDGTTNDYMEIPQETRDKAIYFGLTSAREGYFFDLTTGEYHYKSDTVDTKYPIVIPDKYHMKITGPLSDGSKYEFYQYKDAHTDFDTGFASKGNYIAKHIIGYKAHKEVMSEWLHVDVRLTLCLPVPAVVEPKLDENGQVVELVTLMEAQALSTALEVTLRKEKGPILGVYKVNV